jgi:hypothetical protein
MHCHDIHFKNSAAAILLVLMMPATQAHAEDVLYWMICDCDPTIESEARLEIVDQAGPYSPYGTSPGFEPGDEFIVQDQDLSPIARWKRQANGSYADNSSAGYNCDSGFAVCIDLTGGTLPSPPWIIPTTQQASVAVVVSDYLDCPFVRPNVELSWYPSEPTILNQSFVVQKDRYSNGNWVPFTEGDDDCVVTVQPLGGITYRVKIEVNGMSPSDWVEIFFDYDCEF